VLDGNAMIDVSGYTVEMLAFDDTSGTLSSLDEVVTVTGPLVDLYCWETLDGITLDTQADLTTNPLNHTIHCLAEVEQCRESGYVIVADDDEDGTWETKYILDDALNAEAIAMMLADYPDIASNSAIGFGYTVTLTGRDTGDGILRSLVADDVVMVEGPLVDRYCWETRDGITLDTGYDLTIDPLNHTLHCLVEVDVCRESGYVIVAEDEDGIWETAYILDESQNADVIAMMLADYPNLVLSGNNDTYDVEGYEVVLSGVDYGDGYLRAVDTEVISVTGPLVDRFCWETREGRALDTNANLFIDPLNHTLHCLVEVEQCRQSGYLILEQLSMADTVTVTGPLVDRFCWETRNGITLDTNVDLTVDPLDHTLHCLVEVDVCRESGYVILAEGDDGVWETAYTLDAVLNEQAIAMMLEDHPDIALGGNAVEGSGYTITLTGVDDGNGNLLGGEWQVAYILDDMLNGEAIAQIMEDHPEVTLNGNNAPSLGYTLTISGIDNGDGYLRSEFAEDVTTTEAAIVDTACPDGFVTLGAEGVFGDFTVIIEIDCVAAMVTMNIAHSAYTEQWLGLVFSDNMIGTALIYTTGNAAGASEAVRDLGLYQYDNNVRSDASVNWDESIEWSEISTDLTDGVLQIEFTAPLEGSPIDLSDPENAQLRWAMGTDSSAITYHQSSGRSDDILTLNLLTGASTVDTVSLTAQYAHGVIMWITWAVLASIGIMSSAFRFLYPTGPTWFKIHRGVQISVVVMHLIGFFIAVAFTSDAGVEHFSNPHMKCGLTVTILCCLQPLNAVFRSHPPSGGWKGGVAPVKRQVWEFVHKKSGYIAWILGCVTAFLGMRLPAIDAITLSEVHMYGWCLCLLLAYLVLSVLKCNNAVKEAEMKAMDMPMNGTDNVEMLCAVDQTPKGTAGDGGDAEADAPVREDSKSLSVEK